MQQRLVARCRPLRTPNSSQDEWIHHASSLLAEPGLGKAAYRQGGGPIRRAARRSVPQALKFEPFTRLMVLSPVLHDAVRAVMVWPTTPCRAAVRPAKEPAEEALAPFAG